MAVDQYMTDILKTLNMGATINISTYVEGKDLSRRSVDNFLNSIKNNFLLTSLKNYRGNWKIRAGFLTVLGFNAEEVVVLNHLYERSKMLKDRNNLHDNYANIKYKIADHYRQKAQSKSDSEKETISTSMRVIIQTLEDATARGKKVSIVFNKAFRTVQPFKVYSKEYYWYLGGFEDNKLKQEENAVVEDTNIMKSYTIKSIRKVKILEDENIDYDFSLAQKILPLALNSFISWDEEPQSASLLIHKNLVDNIERAEIYSHWNKINKSSLYPDYFLYKVQSVHKSYKDIIPTIMKHAPEIMVYEPEELMMAVSEHSQRIAQSFYFSLLD